MTRKRKGAALTMLLCLLLAGCDCPRNPEWKENILKDDAGAEYIIWKGPGCTYFISVKGLLK